MLLTDENSAEAAHLSFSMASDIVELVVLSNDEPFLQTMRDASVGPRRLWHVPSADKVSDLLVAGEVGILVIDVQALADGPGNFVDQIKRKFPDLVVVAAGNREAETVLAAHISAGSVYRFIHKPVSPARARLFADAAIRKYDDQRRRLQATPAKPGRLFAGRQRALWGVGAAALCGMAAWLLMSGTGEPLPAHASVVKRFQPAESPLLTRAAAALGANQLVAPSGENALELYLQELARNPSDMQARAGLADVRERLLTRADSALLQERLEDAATDIEIARRSGVDGGRIALLTTQLDRTRERIRASAAGRLTVQAGTPAAAQARDAVIAANGPRRPAR